MMGPERSLVTVMFTDIVGSTERAAELGDRGWRELLQRHHAAVRRELRRFGGREVATAGDGFLATFDEPERAIGCAWAVREAVRTLGLEVRGGLHMGKVDLVGKDVGGIGVHIGARVAARAGPGDVLVSSTVRDALAGSGFTFEDRGVHELKGVPGEWRLFAVLGLPAQIPATRRRGRISRSRPAPGLAALLAVLLAVAGYAAWRATRGAAPDGGTQVVEGGGAARADRPGDGGPAGRETADAGAAASSRMLTLAVLPFRSFTPSEETGFLSVGIPDAIITKLANARQVRLRPTSAILPYENKDVDLGQAGEELASDYLLAGTFQKTGERFRVSVQLVRAADEAPLWGENYDLPRADLLTLQDSIARRVADALEIQLTAAERERLYRRYTENAAAYELYLQGRSHLVRYKKEESRIAIEAFEEALQLDPGYALAHAGLAMASAQMGRDAPESEVESWRNRARAAARRALELDPKLGEAHEALAAVSRNSEFDWERTIEESRRALELNPNLDLPHVYLSGALYHLGLLEASDAEAVAALAINPGAVEPLRLRGTVAMIAGRYSESVRFQEEVQRRSKGSASDWYLAQAYYYAGREGEAEALLDPLRGTASPERRAQATLASFLAARGERQRSEELVEGVEAGSYMDHHVAYGLGVAYAQLGRKPEALAWLERAAETGLPCLPWYERDPLLQPVRDDAAFKQLVERLRGGWETAQRRFAAGG